MNGTAGVNEGVEFKWKSVAGARPAILAQQDLPMPNWIRLTRTGTVFDGYISSDGITWTHLGSTSLAMGSTLLIGTSVASAQHTVWMTASFDHVAIVGVTTPPPPPPSSVVTVSSSTPSVSVSSCTTPDPFAAMGGGTCYNGGWLPPGMAIPSSASSSQPAPAPTPSSPSTTSAGCVTPDPFAAMGGGTCYNGGWLPPGMAIPTATAPSATAPPAAAPTALRASTSTITSSAGCATPDPFAAMGGGTCYNGGWLPPGMTPPAAQAPPPAPAPQPTSAAGCLTPNPFIGIPGLIGACYNGGWIPVQGQTGTIRLINGAWVIVGDNGTTYRPTTTLAAAFLHDGLKVFFAGVPVGSQNGVMLLQVATISAQ